MERLRCRGEVGSVERLRCRSEVGSGEAEIEVGVCCCKDGYCKRKVTDIWAKEGLGWPRQPGMKHQGK